MDRGIQKIQALWMHDGNPKRPHALLRSGKHSTGFFNSRPVIADKNLFLHAISDLIDLYMEEGYGIRAINRVVGPQTGATKMAEFISYEITHRNQNLCDWASPVKLLDDEAVKGMIFNDPDHTVKPEEVVFLCEDVISTSSSIDLTAKAATAAGGLVLPYVVVLVNRSGLGEIDGRKIFALINRAMPMWTPEKCPLCKKGSEALHPKDNWDRLNASY